MSRIYDANSWLSREEYIATKIKNPKKKKRTNKRLQQRKIESHIVEKCSISANCRFSH